MPTAGRFRYLEAAPSADSRGTLVLVHAFPLNARMWEPQLAAIAAAGWRVIAPHLRGFDGGVDEPAASSLDDYASDIAGLLGEVGVRQAVVGGLSMGGYITLALFRRSPELFRAMILADSRSQADTPEGREGRARMLGLIEQQGAGGVADEMVPKLLAAETVRSRPDVVERIRSLILASSSGAIAGSVRALRDRQDATSLVGSIRCPTLLLVGENDAITPVALSEQMHHAIPGSELVVIPRAGHLPNVEEPEAFNRAMVDFLARRVHERSCTN